ncbi:vacuolar protein-sorting-associated protein 25-like [Clytia hemisphaerica]|uniref:vacuolar protein-sorting-associated protein 25-like n=1 Tax=Clytia hemisphaerica TaxID=252671 RepID=UPI0034D7667E|eukprot:TCONS_00060522-protein
MTSTFQWPWQYNFPPFFTIQPNNATQAKQIEAWRALILSYYKHNKEYRLDVTEAHNSVLFTNESIKRKLAMEDIVMVLDTLAKTGHVEWDNDKEKQRCFVMWRTPDEWGEQIYKWIGDNGMLDTVCTLYELHSGDDTTNEEFHGIDINVLLKALEALERRGKAQVFTAQDPSEVGVKFFA